jgi:hypothetical protein
MAERVFRLPDLGEGLEEAEISSWLVAEGDEVVLNQPLVEVETAKAVVEIPSPFRGGGSPCRAGSTVAVAVGHDKCRGRGRGGRRGRRPALPHLTVALPYPPSLGGAPGSGAAPWRRSDGRGDKLRVVGPGDVESCGSCGAAGYRGGLRQWCGRCPVRRRTVDCSALEGSGGLGVSALPWSSGARGECGSIRG